MCFQSIGISLDNNYGYLPWYGQEEFDCGEQAKVFIQCALSLDYQAPMLGIAKDIARIPINGL